ncbi:MAG: alpha/beta family hydrolase, partial [Neoaquamicrobium sediminum]
QGTRDPFGTQEEVAGYKLPASIEIQWFEDGDHDLKPRKWVSGFTQAEHLAAMAEAVAGWARRIIAR